MTDQVFHGEGVLEGRWPEATFDAPERLLDEQLDVHRQGLLDHGDVLLASHAEDLWCGAIAALLQASPDGIHEIDRDG